MRHRVRKEQLNRFTSWRKATLKSLARNLIIYESIKTTKVKAKAVKPLAEELIGLAKENSLTAKRKAYSLLSDHALVKRLFDDIGQRFKDKTGGYVRLLSLGFRRGDSAEMALLELTEIRKEKKKKKAKHEEKAQKAPSEETVSPQEGQPKEIKQKTQTKEKTAQKPQVDKKAPKKFLGGIKKIFKKERDSL